MLLLGAPCASVCTVVALRVRDLLGGRAAVVALGVPEELGCRLHARTHTYTLADCPSGTASARNVSVCLVFF